MNNQYHILVVDDEAAIRSSLEGALSDEGFAVSCAEDAKSCYEKIEKEPPDAILLDIWMPEIDGIEALENIKKKYAQIPVIMMSGHGNIETAVKATKLGAFDFLEKPLSLDKVILLLNNAITASRLEEENNYFREISTGNARLIAENPQMKKLKHQIELVAPTGSWILITGENGTGKEIVARSIHQFSTRRNKPFVDVNCAAIPEELIESELFGYERGAFTGAVTRKKGKFDIADGGTLFLDEIADMSLKTQAKILRILQEQRYERVGGTKTIQVDVRVIAATNKNLQDEIKLGRFREDLFYRLNVIPFHVPSLRERPEDIPLLAEFFLEAMAIDTCKPRRHLAPETMIQLQKYKWPGNVRELKNLMEMLTILSQDELILPGMLPDYIFEQGDFSQIQQSANSPSDTMRIDTLRDARQDFEKQFILGKLSEFSGNISKTADAIGIERSNLHKKIRAYGIDIPH